MGFQTHGVMLKATRLIELVRCFFHWPKTLGILWPNMVSFEQLSWFCFKWEQFEKCWQKSDQDFSAGGNTAHFWKNYKTPDFYKVWWANHVTNNIKQGIPRKRRFISFIWHLKKIGIHCLGLLKMWPQVVQTKNAALRSRHAYCEHFNHSMLMMKDLDRCTYLPCSILDNDPLLF